MIFFYRTIILLLLIAGAVQARTVKLTVLNRLNNSVIAFPHVTVNDSLHYLGNAKGQLEFTASNKTFSIRIYRFQYQAQTITVEADDTTTTLTILLNISDLFVAETSSAKSISIIRNAQQNSKQNNFTNNKNQSFKLYSKFTISSEKPDMINSLLLGGLKLFGVKSQKLFSLDHHFYIMETSSDLHFKNKLNRKERFKNAKSSGIALPLVFAQTSYEFIPNPYSNFVKIKGKYFISPLSYNAISKYSYNIVDSFVINNEKFFTLKFAPQPHTNFNALYGLITISNKNYAIKNIIFYPAWDTKSFKEYCIAYKSNQVLENYTNRISDSSPLQNSERKILIESSTNIYADTLFSSYQVKNEKYNEYVVEIHDKILTPENNHDTLFTRPYPLTKADSLTYKFYEEAMYARVLQQTLTIGENFFYGFIPVGKIDIETDKLINLNDVEGIRLGLGGTTNENFSKQWNINGFIAEGLADAKLKYGIGVKYLLHDKLEWYIGTNYSYQLTESGSIDHYFSRPVFSSEKLRKYQLNIMDYNSTVSVFTDLHPYKNIDFHLATEYSDLTPSYTYVYKGALVSSMHFNVIKIAARFAPFEEYVKLSTRKIELGTKFPVFYIGMTNSADVKGLNGGYDFTKWDFRIDQRIRIVELGTTSVQLIWGIVNGDAPYTSLFNGRGSLKSPSVVMHNSFETMGYNEFLSDNYWALFVSHDFGRLYYKSKIFKPSVLLSYNIGAGSLRNPNEHVGIDFKVMNKPYSEVGLFLNDILSVRLVGLKIGVGGGLFLRMGEYQYSDFNKNAVWKFSLNFNI